MLSISGDIYQGPFCETLSPTTYAITVLYPTDNVSAGLMTTLYQGVDLAAAYAIRCR